MGADSQASEGEAGAIAMKLTIEKIQHLTNQIIWASSGHVGCMQDIEANLATLVKARGEPHLNTRTCAQLKPDLVKAVNDAQKETYLRHLNPPNMYPSSPATSVIFCGMTGPATACEPWILEVGVKGTGQQYESIGFHAIGSGGDMARLAHATLRHYDLRTRPIEHGKVVLYRMLEAVLSSIESVGPPIKMWAQSGKVFKEIGADELATLRDTVGAWKAIERESLNDALTEDPAKTVASPAPSKTEPSEGVVKAY
jgi:ATP-dependent protease HslVU (ClpYQ) peptidase subunit